MGDRYLPVSVMSIMGRWEVGWQVMLRTILSFSFFQFQSVSPRHICQEQYVLEYVLFLGACRRYDSAYTNPP